MLFLRDFAAWDCLYEKKKLLKIGDFDIQNKNKKLK